uniref:Odorant receptor n=1 Tax=Colaphellus bowringi TaxID=561076 RepID=A0A0S3J2P3_9CUCU|nr:odorant receptor OR22 [Colaphellus bowringi]
MSSFSESPENEEQPFSATTKMMRLLCVYPLGFEKWQMVRFYVNVVVVKLFSFFFCCVLCLLHLVMTKIDGAHKADLSEDVSMIMAGTGMLATNLLFAYKVKKWNSLMGKVADSPEMRNIQNFEAIKKRCNRLARLFTMYCVIGAGIYLLSGYYESLVCIRKNEENGSNEICRTLMPVWLPFRLSSAAELTLFALQAFAGINLSLPGANMPFLVWEITEMISLRISHLKKISESIVVEKNIKSRQERLKHWVMSHQQIIECISLLNEQVRLCFGHISTIAALVLGCLANQAINSVHLGAMAELGGWMVGLFLLCSSGQKITDITESVAEAIYAMEWYSTDVQTMRDIRFILMRSQKPLVLQAGPLGALNYPLYMMMVKASYTYLTLLANTI